MNTDVKDMIRVKDIVISKEILSLFKGSIRIVDRLHPAGMWPVDILKLKELRERIPELMKDKDIMKRYDVAIVYKDKILQEKSVLKKERGSSIRVKRNESVNVDLVGASGVKIKKDFSKLGLVSVEGRIISRIPLCGLLIPWRWLKNAKIDYRKFDMILTPKV
ncbi:hypothetical protein BZG02_10240 [Labilibaculum filiforme]|uniref:Uncharacterized protein n=1 Tax=Labilibaculum filiforme TaxID=1940526 RepID=A0A2N3HYK6_9BACT|nr:hypothetical protein [Labilibaculum filiforme]PKQ63132.1 hypothetical protein BZG02_10240 [Labilibaculum filiforme]